MQKCLFLFLYRTGVTALEKSKEVPLYNETSSKVSLLSSHGFEMKLCHQKPMKLLPSFALKEVKNFS